MREEQFEVQDANVLDLKIAGKIPNRRGRTFSQALPETAVLQI